MTDSGLALFESPSYRNFPAGENGFTWAESHFDRPRGIGGDSWLLPLFVDACGHAFCPMRAIALR